MLRLMKLELKKFKFGWYVREQLLQYHYTGIINLVSFIAQIEGDSEIRDPQMILLMASTVVRATFIFGSVLIARLIIGEYKNNTTHVFLSY